jgi:hypothetical protein
MRARKAIGGYEGAHQPYADGPPMANIHIFICQKGADGRKRKSVPIKSRAEWIRVTSPDY